VNLATIIDAHPDDAVAVISRGKTTTYGMLREQVAGFRGGLSGLGLEPGDRLAVACANNWYFVVSVLAGLGAGLVVVPLDPMATGRELQADLTRVGARAVVLGPSARNAFAGVDLGAVPQLEHVIDCGIPDAGGRLLLDRVMAARPTPIVERGPDDLAVLLSTSGTAGMPKAAMLTHGNLHAFLDQTGRRPGSRPDDVVLGVAPFSHVLGLGVVLVAALHAGSAVVLIERFDPSTASDTIARWGVTVLAGPPALWGALAALPDAGPDRFATVRVAVSGGSPLHAHTAALVRDRLGLTLAEGYGLTETTSTVTSSVGIEARTGSVGRPVPGLEVRLVGDHGDDVAAGEPGEIWVRGPTVFRGYWDDPASTAAVLTPDGWLRTGDVAVAGEDGYLVLVDRITDLVIVSGLNVHPAEVETVLREHPGVADVAVVGVPHPYTGETVKGFVVPARGHSVEEDDVIAFARQRLARYKCPTKIEFVDALPEGRGGKLSRGDLRTR
jgi:long-chain acyl-CoA synthetase